MKDQNDVNVIFLHAELDLARSRARELGLELEVVNLQLAIKETEFKLLELKFNECERLLTQRCASISKDN